MSPAPEMKNGPEVAPASYDLETSNPAAATQEDPMCTTPDSYIDTMLSMSRCPRCGHEFDVTRPAGSRLTEDRSIRICGPCDTDEAFEDHFGGDLTQLDEWPIGAEKRDQIAERFGISAGAVRAARTWLDAHPCHPAAEGLAQWVENVEAFAGGHG